MESTDRLSRRTCRRDTPIRDLSMGSSVKSKYRNYSGRNFKRERQTERQDARARSVQMAKIRSMNTKFERDFIELLATKLSTSFVTHVRTLPGTPDLVFENARVCVFLDSDFWHGWQFPRWQHLMKNDFW